MATGICAKTWLQAPFDCTRSDSGTWQAGRRWNLSSMSACAARCLQCERCAWVSYGRRECAWYASCEHPVDKPAYERMRVRATPPSGPRLEAGHTCGRGRMSKAATPAPLPIAAPECPATDPASDFLVLASGRRRLACIGDSITRGDGAHEAGRGSHAPFKRGIVGRGNYPAALQALLGTEEWLVGNFGVSGRTAMPTGDAYAVRAAELTAHAVHMPCTCRAHAVHMPCTCRAHSVHMLSGHARVPVPALLRTGAGRPHARHQRCQACALGAQADFPARAACAGTRRHRSPGAVPAHVRVGRRPRAVRRGGTSAAAALAAAVAGGGCARARLGGCAVPLGWRRAEQLRQARDQHAPHACGGRRGCEAWSAAARHAACLWRWPGMFEAPSWWCCSSAALRPGSGLLYSTLQTRACAA